MSWYKIAQPIQIGGHFSDGSLIFYIDEKRYVCNYVDPPTYSKLHALIKHKNWKSALN